MRRNRPKYSVILSSPITLVAALIVLVLLARSAIAIHAKASQVGLKLHESQANLAKLESSKTKIETELANVSTEAGVKAEIREKYHAVEPGESVAVIVDGDQAAAVDSSVAATSTLPTKQTFWHQLLGILGL